MRVQATGVMAKELNKAIKGNYCIERIVLEKVPLDTAYLTVGYGYFDDDIDWGSYTVKVIKVIYKPECYAMPRYITSEELGKLFRTGMTIKEFTEEFAEEYAI